jgi:hypothetical protein
MRTARSWDGGMSGADARRPVRPAIARHKALSRTALRLARSLARDVLYTRAGARSHE